MEKRILDFLKYCGLSCIALATLLTIILFCIYIDDYLNYFPWVLPEGAWLAQSVALYIFLIGSLFALCGSVRCKATVGRFEKAAFDVVKYFGLFCGTYSVLLAFGPSSPNDVQATRSIFAFYSGSIALLIAVLYAFITGR